MAPEHLEAFSGRSRTVDGRSDVFGLGILLYELLTGQSPFPRQPPPTNSAEVDAVVARQLEDRLSPPPPARQWNQAVSPALDSILRHCLEPDPDQRYQSARHLQEDLQRQLDSLPLKYAREPSLRERLRKLVRRSPKLVNRGLIVLALLLMTLAAVFGVRVWQRKIEVAAHERGIELAVDATAVWHAGEKDIADAKFLLNSSLGRERPALTERAARRVLDRYKVLARADWRDGDLFRPLNKEDQHELEGEVGELLFLLARFLTRPDAGNGRVEEALRLNHEAERCFADEGVPPVLWVQRADLLRRQGNQAEAEHAQARGQQPPRTARGYYLLAGQYTIKRQCGPALPLLQKATKLTPRHYWAWFLLGQCHEGLGQRAEAVARYDVCVALAPRFHGGYFNRGVSQLNRGKWRAALADFDRALELEGESADVYLNRAFARRGLGQHQAAVEDFGSALALEPTWPLLYFERARSRRDAGDGRGADADLAQALRLRPQDVRSWNSLGLSFLNRRRGLRLLDVMDAASALVAFGSGLALDPENPACLRNKSHVLADWLDLQAEALAVQDRIVQLFPESPDALAGRAVVHARLGHRDFAQRDIHKSLLLSPERKPLIVYQAGNVYALTSRQVVADAQRAFPLLHEALRRGFGAAILANDPDLQPLHKLPEFAQLRELAFRLNQPLRPPAPP
jgi:tetratricopeptide (TPR) repeat protein